MKVFAVFAAVLMTVPFQAPPQTPPAAQAPSAPPNCSAETYRQFDFWLGSWNVTVNGKPGGTNRIEAAQSGCVLVENWTGAGGGTGMSLNFYDRRSQQWHQTWIGSGGGALLLNGGLKDGAMVMQSAAVANPQGGTIINRITWTPQPNGAVRQLWETSPDAGKTWTPSFDGIYTKVK
jgi:hypothetical protein